MHELEPQDLLSFEGQFQFLYLTQLERLGIFQPSGLPEFIDGVVQDDGEVNSYHHSDTGNEAVAHLVPGVRVEVELGEADHVVQADHNHGFVEEFDFESKPAVNVEGGIYNDIRLSEEDYELDLHEGPMVQEGWVTDEHEAANAEDGEEHVLVELVLAMHPDILDQDLEFLLERLIGEVLFVEMKNSYQQDWYEPQSHHHRDTSNFVKQLNARESFEHLLNLDACFHQCHEVDDQDRPDDPTEK